MKATGPLTWRIERHDRIPSTNDRAVAAGLAGEPPGLVVIAEEQAAGRGRGGRAWQSPRGNLFCSMLLPEAALLRAGAGALLAGLAAHDALSPLIPAPHALRLKWPNDLLVGVAKIGGILMEGGTAREGAPFLVAGVGINLAHAPSVAGRPCVSLAGLGADVTAAAMAPLLLDAMARRLEGFARSGMGGLVEAWALRGLPEGTSMVVHAGAGTVAGRYAGLDSDGALLLSTEAGLRRIVAGEVVAEV